MKFDFSSNEFKKIVRQSRAQELHEITRRLLNGGVIIYGRMGIGKTTLLEAYKRDNPGAYVKITMLRGYEIALDGSILTPYLIADDKRRPTAFPELLIIDGFDEIRSPRLREQVADILKDGWQRGYKVILSAREQINEKVFEQYASVMHLRGLSTKDALALFDLYEPQLADHNDQLLHLRQDMLELQGNPLTILDFVYLLSNSEHEKAVIYRSPALITEAERPEIVTDIRLINQSILDRIGRKASKVRYLSPRQFEELVAELFAEKGYQVELTPQTRDGGKDFIITYRSDIGNFMIYGECKHHAPNQPVGVGVVSQLLGRINFDKATAGMVVTSSYFSPDAKDFQSQIEHQMKLIDFVQLSAWIEQKTSIS